jgi:ankyrin repeat protein
VSTLDNFKKEAKLWLREVRRKNPGAVKRLRLNYPNAQDEPGLRDIQHALAREHGYESWRAMKAALLLREAQAARAATDAVAASDAVGASDAAGAPDAVDASTASAAPAGSLPDHAARVAMFLEFACWDHRVNGPGDHAMHEHAAMRALARHPEIARDSLYATIVCGDLDETRRILDAQPSLVNAKGGSRGWEPILYLTYARLPLSAVRDNAVAIARELLDRGANPNAYYMAGDAVYSTLVGVAGEGEREAPPHPQRESLYRLLLERGAQPFDIQVLYNTHFNGDMLWWLELTYAYTAQIGREAEWDQPNWPMFDLGGYGSGARFVLEIAIRKGDVALVTWALTHGAGPNAAPSRAKRLSKRSLYEDALREGHAEIADLLLRYGATPQALVLDDDEAFVAAALRLDRPAVDALLAKHPEFLRSPQALFAAAMRDRDDVVAFLLDLGTPIDTEDEHKQQALHIAASSHDARRVASLLIERGAPIDPIETQFGAPPIGYASYHNNQPMIDLLAPVSRYMWTLVYRGKTDRLREILATEPERAKEVSENGITLLWSLPDDETRAVEIVELLLSHGADPSSRAKDRTTAADAARKRGLDRTADILEAAAASTHAHGEQNPGAEGSHDEHGHEAEGGLGEQYESLANDLANIYASGDPAALQRFNAHYERSFSADDVRAAVWRSVRTVREAKGSAEAFGVPEARTLVARLAGFGGWANLIKALEAGSPAPAAFAIDAKERHITPRRHLTARDWDALLDAMKEQRLTALDAQGQMTDALLTRVARLDHVTSLRLGASRELTDAGVHQLARMPQLQQLDFSEYPGGWLTDRGLEVLRHLPELRRFEACWQSGISDVGVANLRFCDRLERVNLMGTPTGDGAVEALQGKPALSRFHTGRLVTDAGLPLLQQFPRFKTWQGGELRYGLLEPDAGPTYLMLDGPFSNASLASLAGLNGLFGLSFFWHASALTSEGLGGLADLANLGMLGCESALCDDRAMRYFAAMPRLLMLMAQGTVATDAGFEALSRSRTLEYIWGRENPNLTGRGFVALSRMPTLRGIAVSCKAVDDDALATLAHFPTLRKLVPIDVSDEGFRHVGRCDALEHLVCMYCRDTTDRATEHLTRLSRLKKYYAGATQITDRSLELLSGIESLESVELYECLKITDAGLQFLARLPCLREVSLSGLPHVTAAGTSVFPAGVRVAYEP